MPAGGDHAGLEPLDDGIGDGFCAAIQFGGLRFHERLAAAFDLGAGGIAQPVKRGSVAFDAHSGFVQLADRRLRASGFFAERRANRAQRAFGFGGGLGESAAEGFDALRDVSLELVGRGFGIVRQAIGRLTRRILERSLHALVQALVRRSYIRFKTPAPAGFGFGGGFGDALGHARGRGFKFRHACERLRGSRFGEFRQAAQIGRGGLFGFATPLFKPRLGRGRFLAQGLGGVVDFRAGLIEARVHGGFEVLASALLDLIDFGAQASDAHAQMAIGFLCPSRAEPLDLALRNIFERCAQHFLAVRRSRVAHGFLGRLAQLAFNRKQQRSNLGSHRLRGLRVHGLLQLLACLVHQAAHLAREEQRFIGAAGRGHHADVVVALRFGVLLDSLNLGRGRNGFGFGRGLG